MTDTTLHYALSTIAQCAAALAALIGFFGLWRLDRLREEVHRQEALAQRNDLEVLQWKLRLALRVFLVVTLSILWAALMGFLVVDQAKNWGGTPWLLWWASLLLVLCPGIVVWVASRFPLLSDAEPPSQAGPQA